MKTGVKVLILLLTLHLISCKTTASKTEINQPKSEVELSETTKSAIPKPMGIINDYGNVFTKSQREDLSKMLYDYDIETTRQIVVVTVDSIKPYQNIQKFASDLGSEWGVGSAETHNGLIIVVCKPCRKIAIATGYGTRLVLTDPICKEVIDKTIIPEFKKKAFYSGVKKGINALMEKWQ